MSVAVDAVWPSSSGTATTGTSLSWSHTCTGSNLLLIVGVAIGAVPDSVTASVTYNSVSMTSLGIVHSDNQTSGYIQMFYLVAPSAGLNSVAVTTNSSATIVSGSISFTGVDQVTPVGTPVTGADSNDGTKPPTAIVSSATGNMVVDALAYGSPIDNPTGTTQWLDNFDPGTAAGNAAQSTYTGASSVTVGYNPSNQDWWGLIAIDIHATAVSPTVTTQAVTSISGSTATGNGTVVSDGGSAITQRGVCWSTSANPTTSDSTATTSGTTGSYSVSMTGLTPHALYHARAYAINANGTSYGSDVAFQDTTISLSWIKA